MSIDVEEIKVLIPRVPEAEKILPYLKRIDENRIYSNFGPLNSELIRRLSTYTGINSDYIATCANATLAIQGLMQTCPLQSEIWELPAWTFTATAAGAINSGRTLKFVDVNSNWRADFSVDSATKYSFIDVASFGDSIESGQVNRCKSLIVDAAPCFDALSNLVLHDNYPVAIVVSLHATKLLPAGEGSFVLSNSNEWISNFQSWSNFGMNSERVSQFLGTNAKLSEFSAAVALASLDNWNQTRARLLELSLKARTLSNQLGFSTSPAMEKGLATPYWILVLNNSLQKTKLIDLLNKNRIGWRDWWKDGIHKMPAYSSLAAGNFPLTDKLATVTIGLPMHYYLTDEDFERIATALSEIRNS